MISVDKSICNLLTNSSILQYRKFLRVNINKLASLTSYLIDTNVTFANWGLNSKQRKTL